ncbi:hydroxyisourate hydrolase [Bordetella genomosp. 10]|uniref:5-hydroxyisourate hydrolase n=2 Tax=Bordetella genomosp. 10 TaxID=1416804 RepID=A0A261S5A1_9BORD|nr:hydroxyisourate hydrolase [Bordetella genomosp. 10]
MLALAGANAWAAPDSLSVHVLDQNTGQPAVGVHVDLERKIDHRWRGLGTGVTDRDGRIKALFPAGEPFVDGEYRVVFHTGDYHGKAKAAAFFPEIVVPFMVEDANQRYHIPLLLSRYGYTVYRGR